jgi:hypothetical protein
MAMRSEPSEQDEYDHQQRRRALALQCPPEWPGRSDDAQAWQESIEQSAKDEIFWRNPPISEDLQELFRHRGLV